MSSKKGFIFLILFFSWLKNWAQIDYSKYYTPLKDSVSFNSSNINFVLAGMDAEFHQIRDSLSSNFFNDANYQYKHKDTPLFFDNNGDRLENRFTEENDLTFSYGLYPYKKNFNDFWAVDLLKNLKEKTKQSVVDSMWNGLYLKHYHGILDDPYPMGGNAFALSVNRKKYNKTILNADSVVFFEVDGKRIWNSTEAMTKGYIFYKKNRGYIIISVGSIIGKEYDHTALQELSKKLDKLMADTWGCIRFKAN